MKKIIVLVALVAFAIGFMFVCGDTAIAAQKETAKSDVKKAETLKAEPKNAETPKKAVCKFKTKEEMQDFEQLYIAKQATFGRMSVLQAYFSMEQNNLQAIDKQMEEKFKLKMDPNKMYDLNRDAMEIGEVGNVPQQQPEQQ